MAMKILYLHAGAEMYGADKVLLELVTGIDKDKFQPIVILPSEGLLVDEIRNKGIDVRVMKYPILRRKFFTFSGIVSYFFNYFRYSLHLLRIVKKEKINLVHVNTTAVLEGIFLKLFSKVPVVWHVHEIIIKPKMMYKLTSLLVSRFSDKVVAVSESVKNHLLESGYFSKKADFDKVAVVYNGVDSSVFNPSVDSIPIKEKLHIPADKVIVGMVGRINRWKGQEDFLMAVSPVLEHHRNVVALMVGGVFEGEEWREVELRDRIISDPNKERIYQVGFVKESNQIQSAIDIFVLPSTNPDPLPTVVLEAMASEKPIVAYNHGGVTEMVVDGYNGFLTPPLNTVLLGENIDKLVSEVALRYAFGKNSLIRQSSFFSLETYIENFEKLYQAV